jgi:hypothetical protein
MLLRTKIVLSTLAALPFAVAAHHSTAMYDDDNLIDIYGIISRVEWANPHAVVYVIRTGDGSEVEWRIELDPPLLLVQRGWNEDNVRIGVAIRFTGAPAKSGATTMRGLIAILDDGTKLRTWSCP